MYRRCRWHRWTVFWWFRWHRQWILGFLVIYDPYQRHRGKMLSPVLLSPAIIVHRFRWYRRKIYHQCRCHQRSMFTGVVDSCNKFIASVLSPAIIVHRCRWYQRKIYYPCRCHRRSCFSGVNDTGDKFIACINDTTDQKKSVTKINHWCQQHRC